MANMDVTQRTQFERVDLSVPSTGVRVRSTRFLVAYTLIALPILGALSWAAVARLDGWSQFVVLGAIVATAVGAMIALSPTRRG
jgi:hypothetical protein